MLIVADTPTELVKLALSRQNRSKARIATDAGMNPMSLTTGLHRGQMHAETATKWIGRILGGEWAVAVGPGLAVAMPAGAMRLKLGVGDG